ncbi:testis-specific serine/threonine-protein kinase 4-like [Sipha flava]|uniref:Testis-specific serine/threonine-protein kinase 4-like n=1 Tax=Sipha flava TaxID=143950 RepID=A0A8B8F3X3_9HEMI|nr:testis-specific serine/threonine-protein kinase 4-like [Sipha flava]
MDYYPDGTLLDYFKEVDHTPEPVAYEWFAQLCSALEYVHGRGFAHRDVKMENVLLDRQGNIRLADFGMCVAVMEPNVSPNDDRERVASRRPVNLTACGTVTYMSPEQLSRVPYNAQLADVWAAGVLLFCLVVGRFPFPYPTGVRDVRPLILKCQRDGYAFEPHEKKRLSIECQSIFGKMFIDESQREEIKNLKKDKWMVKGAQNNKN